MVPDFQPAMMSTVDVELLAVSVVAQTRPWDAGARTYPCRWMRVGSPSLLMVWTSFYPNLLPVVMSTDDVESLAVPMVALTRSQVEGPLVVPGL